MIREPQVADTAETAEDAAAVREALTAIFRSLYIQSPARIAFPAVVPSDLMAPPPSLSPEERCRLTATLRNLLYSRCFSRSAAALCPPEAAKDLVKKLSAANQGRDGWLPGWRIEEVGREGDLVVSRGPVQRAVRAGDYAMTLSEELPPTPGCAVTLRHRRESLTFQAGVYYAFGDADPQPGEEGKALRIYLHAAQESAVPVFAVLTAALNSQGVPFTLKSMLRPDEGDRCDATLLYLPAGRFPVFASLMERFSQSLRSYLAPGAPLFTKPLAVGMGLAESPETGESFGMHRCRLLAEGIVAAWNEGRQDAAARWRSVGRRFAADGLSLARPYLNAGSRDVYGWERP
ncbi:MAG TPA: T3SS effector HopA1 family protein [Thermoanaerobaculia bacterium]|nr:T3SS effector HopA1 family protein [Thermoanaerobaculia bacterium]